MWETRNKQALVGPVKTLENIKIPAKKSLG